MKLIVRMLISAAVIFGVAYLSKGALLQVDSFTAALVAAVVLGLVNTFVKPVVKLLSLPVTIVTLGMFLLVINMFMLYMAAWIVDGFGTVGLWQTFVASLIVAIATSTLTKLAEKDD